MKIASKAIAMLGALMAMGSSNINGAEPIPFTRNPSTEPAFVGGAFGSPIWYGKSQRTKHFNKKRHGRSLRRKHKKS